MGRRALQGGNNSQAERRPVKGNRVLRATLAILKRRELPASYLRQQPSRLQLMLSNFDDINTVHISFKNKCKHNIAPVIMYNSVLPCNVVTTLQYNVHFVLNIGGIKRDLFCLPCFYFFNFLLIYFLKRNKLPTMNYKSYNSQEHAMYVKCF